MILSAFCLLECCSNSMGLDRFRLCRACSCSPHFNGPGVANEGANANTRARGAAVGSVARALQDRDLWVASGRNGPIGGQPSRLMAWVGGRGDHGGKGMTVAAPRVGASTFRKGCCRCQGCRAGQSLNRLESRAYLQGIEGLGRRAAGQGEYPAGYLPTGKGDGTQWAATGGSRI